MADNISDNLSYIWTNPLTEIDENQENKESKIGVEQDKASQGAVGVFILTN